MTCLSDTAQLYTGKCLSSVYCGFGVRGDAVPSSGADGPGILYPGLTLPAEAADEFRARILTVPAALVGLITFHEDSGIEVSEAAPAGVHVGTWRGYKRAATLAPDPSTYTITIGSQVSGNATLDGMQAGGGLTSAADLSGNASLDSVTAAGGLASFGSGSITGNADLDSVGAAGGLESAAALGGNASLDGVSAGGGLAGLVVAELSGNATLDGVSASGGMSSLPVTGRPAWTLLDWSIFMSYTLPYVPGCPDEMVAVEARFACIEWFQRTLCWRETLDPVTTIAGVTAYNIPLPTESALAKLLTYRIDGVKGDVVNADMGETLAERLSSTDVAWTTDRISFNVSPTPIAGKAMVLEVALKPTLDAAGIFEHLWEHYAEHLRNGTLARLFSMPEQPWTNDRKALYHKALFDSAVGTVGMSTSKGFSRARQRARGNFY